MSFLFEKDDEYKKYLRDRVFEESDDNDTKMEKLENFRSVIYLQK